MNVLLQRDLAELVKKPQGRAVSIFMPTQRPGDTVEGPIRLKNLIKQAEEGLAAAGMRPVEGRRMLQPAEALLTDSLFWRNQADGLALFASGSDFRYYRVPYTLDQHVVVSDRYHVKPLLQLFYGDRLFYIIAVSLNNARFYQCTRDGLGDITPPTMPHGMDEALNYDLPGKQVGMHSGPAGSPAGRATPVFHGTAETEYDVVDIVQYARVIDNQIHDTLKEERAPLVLASVSYMLPLYQKSNTYPHLLGQAVHSGNPDRMAADELRTSAWAVAGPHFDEERGKALRLYTHLEGTDRTSSDLEQVVVAADEGRVFKLLFAADQHRWGTYDPESRKLKAHDRQEAGDYDLVDMAVTRTLVTGGTVYEIAPGEMPGDSPVAAVFYYPYLSPVEVEKESRP